MRRRGTPVRRPRLLIIRPRLALPKCAAHLWGADHLPPTPVLAQQMVRIEPPVKMGAGKAAAYPGSSAYGIRGKKVCGEYNHNGTTGCRSYMKYSGQRILRQTTLPAWSRSASIAEKSSSRCPTLESCRCGCCSANAGIPRSSLFGRCSTTPPRERSDADFLGCRNPRLHASCVIRPRVPLAERAAHFGERFCCHPGRSRRGKVSFRCEHCASRPSPGTRRILVI